MIKDSGDRTQFDTGAVRDMHSGKGRCDLLPLDVIYELWTSYEKIKETPVEPYTYILLYIEKYQMTNHAKHIEEALICFIRNRWSCFEDATLELAKHYEDGCQKYGQNNWRRGIPAHCYIDSAIRHFIKYSRGDADERHDRAFVWNLVCLLWTVMNKPDMNDINPKEHLGEQ